MTALRRSGTVVLHRVLLFRDDGEKMETTIMIILGLYKVQG